MSGADQLEIWLGRIEAQQCPVCKDKGTVGADPCPECKLPSGKATNRTATNRPVSMRRNTLLRSQYKGQA